MVQITYNGVDVHAKGDSAPNCEDKNDFIDINQLKQDDLKFNKYGTLEKNQLLLDGSFDVIPEDKAYVNFGLWSKSMSRSDGSFAIPPKLIINFSMYHSSVGITLQFEPNTNDYSSELNIKWYQGNMLLATEDFYPDSAICFCHKNVFNYNKIEITFLKTNNPYRFLKLQAIKYGINRSFNDDELRKVKIIEEVSPTSEEISINTLDFFIDSMDDVNYIFQDKQDITVKFKDNLMGTFFVEKGDNVAERQFDVKAYDLIGLIYKKSFWGGMFSNISTEVLVGKILTGVPFEIDNSLKSIPINGFIPICTSREALTYVAFAIGAIVDTSRSDKIQIKAISDTVKADVAGSDIYSGGSVEMLNRVTGVRLAEYTYQKTDEVQELFNGTDTSQPIIFDEPMWGLVISGGNIVECNENYAIVNRTGDNVTLTGKKYKCITKIISKLDPIVNLANMTNIKEFKNCTLINRSNSDNVIEKLYSYYVNDVNSISKFKFDFNEHKCGDLISFDTDKGNKKVGRITRMEYGLNSNKLAADSEIKDVM